MFGGCDSNRSFEITDYLGTYAGTQTTYGIGVEGPIEETGGITITIAQGETPGTVDLTLAREGTSASVLSGTYDENGLSVNDSNEFSSITFEVDARGDIEGSFSAFFESGTGTVEGRLTPTRFDLTYRWSDGDLFADISASR